MRWRSSGDDANARAWCAGLLTFALTLAAVAILALARSAPAGAAIIPGGPDLPLVPALLVTEEEEEAGEEEAEAEAAEAEEESEDEEGGAGAEGRDECVLRSARATAIAVEPQSRLRLRVNYKASKPAAVILGYSLHGGKGALQLKPKRLAIGRGGVLGETESLSAAELAKALAAQEVTVRIRVLGEASGCGPGLSLRLHDRRQAARTVTWR